MNQESRIKQKIKSIINNSLFIIHSKGGFTLVEVLVVIAMVGVLSSVAIALVNPLEQIKKARDAERKSDLVQIQNALEAYNFDNGRYPSDENADNQIDGAPWGGDWAPYLVTVPKDPLSPSQDYSYQFIDNNSYRLFAKLERCSDPQISVTGICSTAPFNYSVTSSNLAVVPIVGPTLTPTPTNTPTPLPIKRVFATSTTYNGNLGGLTGADANCQTRADVASLGGTWVAWLSTSTVNAKDRIPNAEYRRVDEVVVANDKTDLLDGSLDNAIVISEINTVISGQVWTGTNIEGAASPERCISPDWSSDVTNGRRGIPASSNTLWTYSFYSLCSSFARLYCFEQ